MNKDKLKGIIRGYGDTQAILAIDKVPAISSQKGKPQGQ
jgi:hypothetical protein